MARDFSVYYIAEWRLFIVQPQSTLQAVNLALPDYWNNPNIQVYAIILDFFRPISYSELPVCA
jgi:hypothetical protein